MAKKEIKKTYRIGFVKNTESIIKGFPFIIDRIEFLGNDKIELKTYLTTKVLNIINIDNGIIKVETENSFYIIYVQKFNAYPLWLNNYPLKDYSINAEKLGCDYNYNPPKLTKKAFIKNETIENCELLPVGIFKIFTKKGNLFFGI